MSVAAWRAEVMARALRDHWAALGDVTTGNNFDQCMLYVTISCDAAILHAARRALFLCALDDLFCHMVTASLALSLLVNGGLAVVYFGQLFGVLLLPSRLDSWGAVGGFGLMLLVIGFSRLYSRARRYLLELDL